jgi:hypothetical protein
MWQLKGICSITLTLYSDKTAVVFAAAAFSAFIQCSFVFTARKYFCEGTSSQRAGERRRARSEKSLRMGVVLRREQGEFKRRQKI